MYKQTFVLWRSSALQKTHTECQNTPSQCQIKPDGITICHHVTPNCNQNFPIKATFGSRHVKSSQSVHQLWCQQRLDELHETITGHFWALLIFNLLIRPDDVQRVGYSLSRQEHTDGV